jgi:SAM-dependent methyltransferase
MAYGPQEAAVYDVIHNRPPDRDYQADARLLLEIIARDGGVAERSVLDVGCGTGLHLELLLAAGFEVEGLDVSEDQLAIAAGRLPEVKFHRGDMADFDTGRRYGHVCCLFSSVGYMVTPPRLNQAIAAMGRHVLPGGLLIVEPWHHPDTFGTGTSGRFVEQPGLTLARFSIKEQDGQVSTATQHYFVDRGGAVTHFVETHVMGLFTIAEYEHAFRAAGFAVWHDRVGCIGRGLFVGRRGG